MKLLRSWFHQAIQQEKIKKNNSAFLILHLNG